MVTFIVLFLIPFAIMGIESLCDRFSEEERHINHLADKSRKKALKRPQKRNAKYCGYKVYHV